MKERFGSKAVLGAICLGLLCLSSTGSVWAHTGVNFLAPENDFVVKWYQPHGEVPVEYWDVEVTTLEGTRRTFIEEARVFSDRSCWGVDVPTNVRSRVRIRGVGNGQVSGWSGYTVVPEPSFGLSALVSVGALLGLRRWKEKEKGEGKGKGRRDAALA